MPTEIDDAAWDEEEFPWGIVRVDDLAVIILYQAIENIEMTSAEDE